MCAYNAENWRCVLQPGYIPTGIELFILILLVQKNGCAPFNGLQTLFTFIGCQFYYDTASPAKSPHAMYIRILFTAFGCLIGLASQAQSGDTIHVLIFLLEDCKISQAYTARLTTLHSRFGQDSIRFVGLFPNPVSEEESVRAFQEKYQLPFPLSKKDAKEIAWDFGVTVTPEVVVVRQSTKTVLYQGRIDNMFERVGKRRRVVTSNDLELALEAIRANRRVPVSRTQPIGCFLPQQQPR